MKTLFQSQRLIIREMTPSDIDGFFDMQSSHTVMDMVPDKVMTMEQCVIDLDIRIKNYTSSTKEFDVWGVIDKETNQFTGTCALVYNQKGGIEIGYRFLEKFWGKGIATEVTEGLIEYVFTNRIEKVIVADVSKFNLGSTKVLGKFMSLVGETYNKEDDCQDLHFELKKENYSAV
jgi:ribosomal-protein-alanine N-acetyltransferase